MTMAFAAPAPVRSEMTSRLAYDRCAFTKIGLTAYARPKRDKHYRRRKDSRKFTHDFFLLVN